MDDTQSDLKTENDSFGLSVNAGETPSTSAPIGKLETGDELASDAKVKEPLGKGSSDFGDSDASSSSDITSEEAEEEPKFETPLIHEKLQRSYAIEYDASKLLASVYSQGKELATNVCAASNLQQHLEILREVDRDENTSELVAEMQEKARIAHEKLLSKFTEISSTDAPDQLQKMCSNLEEECKKLLEEKDATIQRIETEMELKKAATAEHRKHREQEAKMVSQRMDKLVDNLSKYSKIELGLVRNALTDVQNEMMNNKSNVFHKRVAKDEEQYVKYDDYEAAIREKIKDIHSTLLSEYDKLQVIRVRLMEEVHNLLMQMRKTQADQFLNLDKMIYGIHIMNKQIRENKIISSEMKRSNIRSVDVIHRLRAQMKDLNQTKEEEHEQAITHYNKTDERIRASLKAARYLHNSHKKTFAAAFHQQETEARRLLNSVVKIDRFIFEVLLRSEWKAPDLSFLSKRQEELRTKEQKLLDRLKSFLTPVDTNVGNSANPGQPLEMYKETCLHLKKPLEVERLLVFLCEEMDFLLDKYVVTLAKSVFPDIKAFIISNSVFSILGIKTEEDLYLLLAYILHHSKIVNEDEVFVSRKNIRSALRAYITSQKEKLENEELVFDAKLSTDPREKPDFWNRFTSVVSPPQIELWDTVLRGLKDYVIEMETKLKLSDTKKLMEKRNRDLQLLLNVRFESNTI